MRVTWYLQIRERRIQHLPKHSTALHLLHQQVYFDLDNTLFLISIQSVTSCLQSNSECAVNACKQCDHVRKKEQVWKAAFFQENCTCNFSQKTEKELICLVVCGVLAGMRKVNLECCWTSFHWKQLLMRK